MIGRTRWQTLVALATASGAVSYVVSRWWVGEGRTPLPIPPTIALVLAMLAVVLFFLGRSVRRFTQGKRASMDPLRAFRILVLAKASALGGSVQLGFFTAQTLLLLGHLDAPDPRALAWSSGAAAVACLVLVIVALVVEWFCRVPPVNGDEGERGNAA